MSQSKKTTNKPQLNTEALPFVEVQNPTFEQWWNEYIQGNKEALARRANAATFFDDAV